MEPSLVLTTYEGRKFAKYRLSMDEEAVRATLGLGCCGGCAFNTGTTCKFYQLIHSSKGRDCRDGLGFNYIYEEVT